MDRDGVLVAALGAAVLSGCTSHRDPAPTPTPSPATPPPDPDLVTLESWWSSEHGLHGRSAHPTLRANHLARLHAVEERLRARGSVAPPAPRRVPAGDLAALERAAAARYLASLAAVTDPDVATLGAELAAGARQHAVVIEATR